MMNSSVRATHAFLLYCVCVVLYLTVGGVFQARWGLRGIALNQVVFLVLPALLYTRLSGLSLKKIFPLRRPSLQDVLVALLFTALLLALVELLLIWQERLWPLPQDVRQFYERLKSPKSEIDIVLKVVVLALLPALCEEFFFRGFLQGIFAPVLGPSAAIAFVALLFAAAHANSWYFPYYFLLGVYLSAYRQWKGNLALCILIHALNNLYSLRGMFGI